MFVENACKEQYGVHLDEFVKHHVANKAETLDEFKGYEYSALTPKVNLLDFITGWKVLSYLDTKGRENYLQNNKVKYYTYYLLGYWPWLFFVVIPASAMSILTSVACLFSEGMGLVADYAKRDLKRDFKNHNWLGVMIWVALCVYLLLSFIRFQSKLGKSLYEMLRILQLNLFEKRDLLALLRGGSAR